MKPEQTEEFLVEYDSAHFRVNATDDTGLPIVDYKLSILQNITDPPIDMTVDVVDSTTPVDIVAGSVFLSIIRDDIEPNPIKIDIDPATEVISIQVRI